MAIDVELVVMNDDDTDHEHDWFDSNTPLVLPLSVHASPDDVESSQDEEEMEADRRVEERQIKRQQHQQQQ